MLIFSYVLVVYSWFEALVALSSADGFKNVSIKL